MQCALSKEALKIHKTLNKELKLNVAKELGIKFTVKGTFLPKDFCVCSLLSSYQRFKELTKEQMDIIFDFAYFLELFLAVHDGRNDKI